MSKIAILYTDHQCDWVKPWNNFAEMGINTIEQGRALHQDSCDIQYKIFDIYNRQFPEIEELSTAKGYCGIYITGSRYDSFDTETTWINEFRLLLRTLLTEDGYPPIVGVCFGHQIIASALDCKVSRNPRGLEIGVTPITLNETGLNLFRDAGSELNLSELHYDIVRETPRGYQNWGSSPLCERQGFYKPRRLISFQGHPEFNTEASQALLKSKSDKLSEDKYDLLRSQNASLKNDGSFVAKYIWKLFKQEI